MLFNFILLVLQVLTFPLVQVYFLLSTPTPPTIAPWKPPLAPPTAPHDPLRLVTAKPFADLAPLLDYNRAHSMVSHGRRVVAYYTAWSIYGRKFTPDRIPVERLTHLIYAFANIENGEIALGDRWADVEVGYPGDHDGQPVKGNFNQLTNPNSRLRQRNPNLKVLIAVGGWSWSSEFARVASTDESRRRFARSVGQFVRHYNFDGVDIDWEFPVVGGLAGDGPRTEEAQNFVALLQTLHNELAAASAGRREPLQLTAAMSASQRTYRHYQFQALSQWVDFFNVMTYDFKGPWSQQTGHQACLTPAANDPTTSIWTSINEYLAGGVPPNKIVLGVPFYGRGFANVAASPDNPSGLFVPFQGVPKGTWEDGVFDYRHLRN
ncbi:hypothetical protein H4R35_004384, partial [Dimargaris xerosporica]